MKQAADEIERLRKVSRDQAGVELSEENDRLIDDNKRLRAALDIARTALLIIERRCEEGRAELTRAHEQAARSLTPEEDAKLREALRAGSTLESPIEDKR